jgi:hypothetical protein
VKKRLFLGLVLTQNGKQVASRTGYSEILHTPANNQFATSQPQLTHKLPTADADARPASV